MSRHHHKTDGFEKELGISPPGSGETGSYQGDAEAGENAFDWQRDTACPPGGTAQGSGSSQADDDVGPAATEGFAGDTGEAGQREDG